MCVFVLRLFFSTDPYMLRASWINFMFEVHLILYEQWVTGKHFISGFKTAFRYIKQYLSHTMYKMFRLKMEWICCLIRDELWVYVFTSLLCTDAWNKLGTFPNVVNCPCHNCSGIPFFNIQCSADASYKSSVICLMFKKKKKQNTKKLPFFQLSHCSVWSYRLCRGLTEEQSDWKYLVWPFKVMSKRENVHPALCISSAPHSEQVVHKGQGQCVCVYVCECRGLQ